MRNKIFAVLLSALLLSAGWLRITGLTLAVALVPLLVLSEGCDASRRSWWRMAGWTMLTMLLWYTATCWWIWHATAPGAAVAVVVSSTLFTAAFMLYHYVAKRAKRALAYCVFVSAWIAAEYWYLRGEVSFPWLVLGNGMAGDVWAVQWYEWTGVFGGSLWLLVCNLLFFEAWRLRSRRSIVKAAAAFAAPLFISLALWWSYDEPANKVRITVVQPNISCFPIDAKFDLPDSVQDSIFYALGSQAPPDSRFVLLPETALAAQGIIWENDWASPSIDNMRRLQREHLHEGEIIAGASTMRYYPDGVPSSPTARCRNGIRYDVYNTALAFDSTGLADVRHKIKLVVGAEKVPYPKLMEALSFLIVELGGSSGQLGVDDEAVNFEHDSIRIGTAICYESIYGDFFADFVRRGADVMGIITNDGWWGDTAGHRQHFSYARLRAIETRRSIARSANTGISGFIDPRGRVLSSLGWDERGTLTADIPLNDRITLYVRYGDYVARLCCYLLLLCVLYFCAYCVRRRNHLVD